MMSFKHPSLLLFLSLAFFVLLSFQVNAYLLPKPKPWGNQSFQVLGLTGKENLITGPVFVQRDSNTEEDEENNSDDRTMRFDEDELRDIMKEPLPVSNPQAQYKAESKPDSSSKILDVLLVFLTVILILAGLVLICALQSVYFHNIAVPGYQKLE